jgi:hypothetical protein
MVKKALSALLACAKHFAGVNHGCVYTSRMRAYFAGSSVPTPEEMGKMLAASPEQAAAARKLKSLAVGGKNSPSKKPAPARVRKSLIKKQP